jgi:hypothetical protein
MAESATIVGDIMSNRPSSRRHPLGAAAVVLGLLGGSLFVVNCVTEFFCPIAFPFTHLGALRGDEMAAYEPPSTELLDAEYRHKTSFFWGSLAGVTRTFRIIDPDSTAQALEDFHAAAKANGWTYVEENRFCKELRPGIALLSISVQDGATHGTPWDRLRIGMGYDYGAVISDAEGGRFIQPSCPRLRP